MTLPVRIGFLSAHAPDDVRAQSGIPWHMRAALQRHCGTLIELGPGQPWIARPLRLLSRASAKLSRRHRFIDTNSETLSRSYGQLLARRVADAAVDWIFAPFASAELAHLETNTPIVYFSDTTFRRMCDYYPDFTGLPPRARRSGDRLESRAMTRASLACFASRWAADSAVADYGIPPAKVRVLPLSANLVDAPPHASLRTTRVAGPWQLLFIGVDWERKGGPIAIDALLALRRLGFEAELTIAGCTPSLPAIDGVRTLGFVSKSSAGGREKISALLRASDFLILPTRAECYGCVFVEAAAYALPSVAADTGGVRDALADGAAGLLLPLEATGEEYARRMAEVIVDPERYAALRSSARKAYDAQLSWEAWAGRINALTAAFRR